MDALDNVFQDAVTPDDQVIQDLEPTEDMLGASLIPDVNRPGTGWNLYEDGQFIQSIVKSNMHPGGFEISRLGASEETPGGIDSIMDDLAFKEEDVLFPWSSQSNSNDEPNIIGTPDYDTQYWQPQTTEFTCAVQSQRGIIEAFTGQEVSEAQLVYDATINGWLTSGGMSPHDVGNLLEHYGIPCHTGTDASIEDLMSELAQGHKVIVGLDAGEIWKQDSPLQDFFHQSADHAIWVTGVNMSDPAHPMVIVNDSGDSAGAGKAYDLSLFKDAWEDSGFFYVATDNAPEGMNELASSQGFDKTEGVFSSMSSYFDKFYEGFHDKLQQRTEDQTPISPAETPTLFIDAAIRSFIQNLPDNPTASLSESSMDTFFRAI